MRSEPRLATLAAGTKYDPARFVDRNRYTIHATIRDNGKLLFTSTQHVAPFADEPGNVVKVTMQQVPASGAINNAKPRDNLGNTYWARLARLFSKSPLHSSAHHVSKAVCITTSAGFQYKGCHAVENNNNRKHHEFKRR